MDRAERGHVINKKRSGSKAVEKQNANLCCNFNINTNYVIKVRRLDIVQLKKETKELLPIESVEEVRQEEREV